MGDLGKVLGWAKTIVVEASRPKSEAPFAHLSVPEGGPGSGLVICSVCKKLKPPPPKDSHLLARVDDPSGKVKGIIPSCKECRGTRGSKTMTFVCVFAILCGVAFASYALIMAQSGIDPESHWFGSVSLAFADWTGKNYENIEGFARLLELLIYVAGGLVAALGLLYRRARRNKEAKDVQSGWADQGRK